MSYPYPPRYAGFDAPIWTSDQLRTSDYTNQAVETVPCYANMPSIPHGPPLQFPWTGVIGSNALPAEPPHGLFRDIPNALNLCSEPLSAAVPPSSHVTLPHLVPNPLAPPSPALPVNTPAACPSPASAPFVSRPPLPQAENTSRLRNVQIDGVLPPRLRATDLSLADLKCRVCGHVPSTGRMQELVRHEATHTSAYLSRTGGPAFVCVGVPEDSIDGQLWTIEKFLTGSELFHDEKRYVGGRAFVGGCGRFYNRRSSYKKHLRDKGCIGDPRGPHHRGNEDLRWR